MMQECKGSPGGMLPCISPPKITPMDPPMKPLLLYYMRLCFYVLRAFLPSLPGRCRHTDHGVKLLPADVL